MTTDLTQRTLGKDYRAWLRDHNADDMPPLPLVELFKTACSEEPYNNRKGTWPAIVTTWLPYLLDRRQYKPAYQIIETAFRHTNSSEDQKNWSTSLLHCPVNVRRTIFRESLDLLIEALNAKPRQKNLLAQNMHGLFSEPQWIEPSWFSHWGQERTLRVMQSTGVLKEASGAMLQLWLTPVSEREERLSVWLKNLRSDSNTSRQGDLLNLLPCAWQTQLYEAPVGRAVMHALTTPELVTFTNALNTNVSHKYASSILQDALAEVLKRDDDCIVWPTLLGSPTNPTPLRDTVNQLFLQWDKVVKSKHFDRGLRARLLAVAICNPEIISDENVNALAKREKIPEGMLGLLRSLDITQWSMVVDVLEQQPDPSEMPELPENLLI